MTNASHFCGAFHDSATWLAPRTRDLSEPGRLHSAPHVGGMHSVSTAYSAVHRAVDGATGQQLEAVHCKAVSAPKERKLSSSTDCTDSQTKKQTDKFHSVLSETPFASCARTAV